MQVGLLLTHFRQALPKNIRCEKQSGAGSAAFPDLGRK